VDQVDLAGGIEEPAGVSKFSARPPARSPIGMSLRRESELAVAQAAAERSAAAKDSPSARSHCSAPRFNSLVNCCRRHRIPRNRKAATTALATTLKQKLTDLVNRTIAPSAPTFALPDATALDG